MELPVTSQRMAAFSNLYAERVAEVFTQYQTGDGFTIWLYNDDPRIEYVELVAGSKPHCHTQQSSYFWFLTPAVLVLGGSGVIGLRVQVNAHVTRFAAEPGVPYPVPPYVFHSVEPAEGYPVAKFFIFNSATRERTASAYTDDSVFPDFTLYRDEKN
jgi:hypothetical protein